MSTRRRQGLIDRTRSNRDARICFIATEDTYAPRQYFESLMSRGLLDSRKVHVHVVPTEDGRSSLAALIERLDTEKANLTEHLTEDESWAVFDVDHHRPPELSQQTTVAQQKGLGLAGSNPCFEVWLLLHETDDLGQVQTYDQDRAAARKCEALLRQQLGGSYSKTNLSQERYQESNVRLAVIRAQARDDHDPRWPQSVGTHVHRLVNRLLRTIA